MVADVTCGVPRLAVHVSGWEFSFGVLGGGGYM